VNVIVVVSCGPIVIVYAIAGTDIKTVRMFVVMWEAPIASVEGIVIVALNRGVIANAIVIIAGMNTKNVGRNVTMRMNI